VPTLSLGYGGGQGAFLSMAKNYGVRLDVKEVAKIVKQWREANAWAPRFWEALESAAKMAMSRPGVSYSAGRVQYRYDPLALGGMGALFCILPSGREICYPDPLIEIVEKAWGDIPTITCRKGSWRPKKGTKLWPRVALWKGLMAENVTQAACADLLNNALLRTADAGLCVAAHTHDEILIETARPKRDSGLLKEIMEARPGWRGDDALPLKAEVEYGYRYKVPSGK
jgi:DNA polymerase